MLCKHPHSSTKHLWRIFNTCVRFSPVQHLRPHLWTQPVPHHPCSRSQRSEHPNPLLLCSARLQVLVERRTPPNFFHSVCHSDRRRHHHPEHQTHSDTWLHRMGHYGTGAVVPVAHSRLCVVVPQVPEVGDAPRPAHHHELHSVCFPRTRHPHRRLGLRARRPNQDPLVPHGQFGGELGHRYSQSVDGSEHMEVPHLLRFPRQLQSEHSRFSRTRTAADSRGLLGSESHTKQTVVSEIVGHRHNRRETLRNEVLVGEDVRKLTRDHAILFDKF